FEPLIVAAEPKRAIFAHAERVAEAENAVELSLRVRFASLFRRSLGMQLRLNGGDDFLKREKRQDNFAGDQVLFYRVEFFDFVMNLRVDLIELRGDESGVNSSMHKNNTADFRNCGMAPDPLAIDSGGAEDFVVF